MSQEKRKQRGALDCKKKYNRMCFIKSVADIRYEIQGKMSTMRTNFKRNVRFWRENIMLHYIRFSIVHVHVTVQFSLFVMLDVGY